MEMNKNNEKQAKTEYSKAARDARNAYKRKWNAEHKDRVKEYARRYWEKVSKMMEENKTEEDK